MSAHTFKRVVLAAFAFAITPALGQAQPTTPTFLNCMLQSTAAGLAATPLSLLGIPEANGEAPLMFGLKMAQACALNDAVGVRNARYAASLPAEVLKFARFDTLFREREQVIGYGDVPGTEVGLGAGRLQFVSLIPAMLQENWTRSTAGSPTPAGQTPRAQTVVTTVAGTTHFRDLFRDPSANSSTREAQAYTDGAEVATEAALTAEESAQDLAVSADSIEAILKTVPPGSGRARQLRALALVRTALASNQRLRLEAAMLRAAADVAQTGLSDGFMDRVSTGSNVRIAP